MKILVFNWRDITHPWAGGAERHLHELAKRWVKKGHEVNFIVGGYKGSQRREEIDGINFVRVGDTYSNFLLGPLYYLFRARNRGFDCLIDTAHGVPYFLPLFTRTPIILVFHHNHEKLWKTEFGGIFSKIGIFLENNIVPLIYKKHFVVTLSETEKKSLKKAGFTRVMAIPPGIDSAFKPGTQKTKNPTILYLGRLRRYKRVDLLINIFPEIRRKVKNVTLVIAGDGQDRARIEGLVRRKNLKDKIVLKGFVSEEEKLRLLQSSWVLAFPSMMEGWGLVAMEAAACGTPTVGFRVPGVQDAVKDNVSGILSSDKKEFVKDLIRVLSSKRLRDKLSKGAVAWATKFTWQASAGRFLEEIEDVTSEYGENYFSNFWRMAYKRKFHPVYDFRVWYIASSLKPKRLLDIGCGTGVVVNALRDRRIAAYGMDVSKEAFSRIPKDRQRFFFLGDIRKIPRKPRSFDTVACIDVLEHIESNDLRGVIRECARVARKNIYFDITVLEDPLFIFSDPTHISKHFSWQWKKIIMEALGPTWRVRRGPILPFIHHGMFVAERVV